MGLGTYHKLMSQHPHVGTALNSLLAGAATYAATDRFAPLILGLLLKGRSPEIQQRAIQAFQHNRHRLPIMAGTTAAGAEALRSASVRFPKLQRGSLSRVANLPAFKSKLWDPVTMEKKSSSILESDIIPVKNMISSINHDRFLDNFEKLKAGRYVFDSDKERKGLVSGKKVAETAVKAGVGFVPAYAFGRTLGHLAGFPPDSLNRLASTGGIAAALYNTGIFKE